MKRNKPEEERNEKKQCRCQTAEKRIVAEMRRNMDIEKSDGMEQIEKAENEKTENEKVQNRELVCIRCPIGCMITVENNPDGTLHITGNTCSRGAEYAEKELTNPTRIVTSTVRVRNGKQSVVSVKTKGDIPKEKIMECIEAIKSVELEAPVHIGDVALADAAGTGVDMVVTKDVGSAPA